MSVVALPATLEPPMLGMNSRDDARQLVEGVYQKVVNSYPGRSCVPRNGVSNVRSSRTALGYGTKETLFQPGGIFVQAGGKDFIFAWHRNLTTDTEYGLEVWNLTDGGRSLLISADFGSNDVYFGMVKLYGGIYCVMDHEISTPHNSAYRTKNKIIEWDTVAGAWAVREMMVDVAPAVPELKVFDSSGLQFWAPTDNPVLASFAGKMWLYGGSKDQGTTPNAEIWSSLTGKDWEFKGFLPKPRLYSCSVSFRGKLYIIGGTSGTDDDDVISSVDGISWSTVAENQFGGHLLGAFATVFLNKIWVVAGQKVWSSADGVTWVAGTTTAFSGASLQYSGGLVAYSGYLYAIGVNNTGVWRSADGATWASVATLGATAARVVVNTGKMWVLQQAIQNSYYSTNGTTWTETTPSDLRATSNFGVTVFEGLIVVAGGQRSLVSLAEVTQTSDGTYWEKLEGGVQADYYGKYAFTFVRRDDASSKLDAISDYRYESWETVDTNLIVGVDEKLLDGTVTLSGTTLTGTGTSFDGDLAVDDYVRIDGDYRALKVTAITSDTVAAVTNADAVSYTAKRIARLPLAGDPITSFGFVPGKSEGVADTEKDQIVFVSVTTDYGRILISMPDVTAAVAQGATHLRVYRTLFDSDYITAEGLNPRFLVDIAISGNNYDSRKVYRDQRTDDSLSGQTNVLEMVGYTVPPQGRFVVWVGGVLFIGGNPDNPGYWFHSTTPSDTRYPEKYASMFRTSADFGAYYLTCDPDDGQKDSGCVSLAGDLYFFKERKIFKLNAANPFDNNPERISNTIGCVCPNSITLADIPLIGGECCLFESESGPAVLFPGGKIDLLHRFAIAELWPTKNGVLQQAAKYPDRTTDWYSRNRVTCGFQDNAWWFFFGDSTDVRNNVSANKCFGMRFSEDGESIGAFEFVFGEYTLSATNYRIIEPVCIIPKDNLTAFCLSHFKFNSALDGTGADYRYRVMRLSDPAYRYDSYAGSAVTGPITMEFQTREMHVGPYEWNRCRAIQALVYLFAGSIAAANQVVVSTVSDRSRQVALAVYDDVSNSIRQSGAQRDNTYRHFINVFFREGLFGSFFDTLFSMDVPDTGTVPVFRGIQLLAESNNETYPPVEFTAGAAEATGADTFVVEADSSPEVDAHA